LAIFVILNYGQRILGLIKSDEFGIVGLSISITIVNANEWTDAATVTNGSVNADSKLDATVVANGWSRANAVAGRNSKLDAAAKPNAKLNATATVRPTTIPNGAHDAVNKNER